MGRFHSSTSPFLTFFQKKTMITLSLITFVISFLLTVFSIAYGQQKTNKITGDCKKIASESFFNLLKIIREQIGNKNYYLFILLVTIFSIILIIINTVLIICFTISFALGSYCGKKAFEKELVANNINRLLIIINKLKK